MRVVRSFAATLVVVAIVVGVPVGLIAAVGNPAEQWPALAAGDISDRVVLAVLAVIVWIAWAQFTVAMLVELASGIRRTPVPRRIPGVFAAQQHLARTLVTAVLMLAPAVVSAVSPAVAALTTAAPAAVASYQVPAPAASPRQSADLSSPALHDDSAAVRSAARAVQITSDGPHTWWDLATVHTGDGRNWSTLWQLNAGRPQPGGARATATGLLRDGWNVLVPATTSEQAEPAEAPARSAAAGVDVTVQPGDSLAKIASDHDTTWPQLWQANKGRTEPDQETLTDPDHIEPGWTITIPTPPAPAQASAGLDVTVQPGDSLAKIASDHDTSWPQLWQANKGRTEPDQETLTDPDHIEPGWTITIPSAHHQPPAGVDTVPAGGRHHAAGPTADQPDSAAPAEPSAPPSPPTTSRPPATSTSPQPARGAPESAALSPAQTTPPAPSGTAGLHLGDATAPPAHRPGSVTTAVPTPAASAARQASIDGEAEFEPIGWPMLAIVGGGIPLLAGVSFLTLRRYRRRQDRFRRPGRAIAGAPARLRRMEQALLTAGPGATGTVNRLDHALRGLAAAVRDGTLRALPAAVAVRIGPDGIELLLARADVSAPEPWRADADGLHWLLPAEALLIYDDATEREHTLAPYPALVSVGHTSSGEQWLLDVEQIGALRLTGPAARCADLLRFMAAELAHNTWSEMLTVTAAGLGSELAPLNPDRLTITDDPAAATAQLRRHVADVRTDRDAGVSVLDGRALGGDREVWPPQVLLLADGGDTADLSEVIDQVQADPARLAAAVVLTGRADVQVGWQARLDEDGLLHIPDLGIHVIAERLPAQEAGQLAELLAGAGDVQDVPTPPSTGDRPWNDFADAAGAPVPDAAATGRPPLHVAGQLATSTPRLLPLSIDAYTARAAATAEDVQALAPSVGDGRRGDVETSLSGLDADLADWREPDCPRPKITLLGPVQVHAGGQLPTDKPRVAWNTEVMAFLACRPQGATAEQYGTALWPDDPDIVGKSKVRQSVHIVRRWLGANPRTGRDYLPTNPGVSGIVYRIEDALVDADLFRQLRLRGTARGADGIADLQTALTLVRGLPFDRRRPAGYGWLAADALDHQYTAMIVDVAHTVATHHLAAGDPTAAAAAAEVALLAGSFEDTPLLDLAAACEARGMDAEVEAYVRRIMANHDVDEEVDLPPRTFEILHRRGWLREAS